MTSQEIAKSNIKRYKKILDDFGYRHSKNLSSIYQPNSNLYYVEMQTRAIYFRSLNANVTFKYDGHFISFSNEAARKYAIIGDTTDIDIFDVSTLMVLYGNA